LHCEIIVPLPLIILALSAFAIGTTEFVIMGLLPEVAGDLHVSITSAGWLVTGYALGVAIGAPFMAVATARLPKRKALILLMGIFVVGNLLCALAGDYRLLMFARVVTALCHGAFFGIGSVVAASLVAPNKRAQAVALMFTGLTLANVLGVPLGTALGQAAGWHATFWAVTVLGVASLAGLIFVLPHDGAEAARSLRSEIAALGEGKLLLALATTVFFSGSMFAVFTYIAPLLREVTHVTPRGVTWTLLLIGVGLTVGNLIGGKLADRHLSKTLGGVFIAIAATSVLFAWSSAYLLPAEVTLFVWAAASFAAVSGLQINVVQFGRHAPNLVSTLNISAFNTGNALGAWVGGVVIDAGLNLRWVPVAGGALALGGLLMTILTYRKR
jgi:DHA1 family inner membrane transport protein